MPANDIDVVTRLEVTRRDGSVHQILFDTDDLVLVGQHTWHVFSRTFPSGRQANYARTNIYDRGKQHRTGLFMHRLLLPDTVMVDHINGNGLDNRRANIRPATHAQNHANQRPRVGTSSRFKGVSWHKKPRNWMARIKCDGRQIYLGSFMTEEEAALAYNVAALDLFGEYANLNKVDL